VRLFGARRHPRTAASPIEGHLPGFDGATGWLNSSPLTPAELRGRVVLVDFWTYTCINWLRTLAFVRAWAAKYRDLGLVVIGVHTPEFPFEREAENVREAAQAMRVEYPIALDSDYGLWSAFANRYWLEVLTRQVLDQRELDPVGLGIGLTHERGDLFKLALDGGEIPTLACDQAKAAFVGPRELTGCKTPYRRTLATSRANSALSRRDRGLNPSATVYEVERDHLHRARKGLVGSGHGALLS
jgi:thiol-disulfide isomerase/thioredoxin